ncbi:MAG TPA: DUF1289 domain-containing protein [Methylophilaceae bacterium]|nr:DUF1289 domain-containing protein [Methylophilaceae bacterium]
MPAVAPWKLPDMPPSDPTEIQSPCIGVCTMSEATGLCLGCFRTIEEIREWWDMTNDQRSQLMDALEARQAEHLNFD